MNDDLTKQYNDLAGYRREHGDIEKVYALKKAYHRKNILSRIGRRFAPSAEINVLEFGPGIGCTADLIHASYAKVDYSIVDCTQGVLDEVQAKFPQIAAFFVEDAEQLAKIDKQFDVIVAVDVWEHLPPDLLVPYTRWCWQQLKPGGMLIIQVPNWGCPLTAATFCSDLTHVNQLNEKSVRQLFRMVGIDDACFAVFNRLTPGFLGAVRDAILRIYCIYLRALYVLFGSVRLKVFSPDLVAVAEKKA